MPATLRHPPTMATPSPATPPGSRTSMLSRLGAAVAAATRPLECLTTVHPCYVDGRRTLVYARNLADAAPAAWAKLRAFALQHGFTLLPDRRKRERACRDERRRLAPVLLFVAAGFAGQLAIADDGTLAADAS